MKIYKKLDYIDVSFYLLLFNILFIFVLSLDTRYFVDPIYYVRAISQMSSGTSFAEANESWYYDIIYSFQLYCLSLLNLNDKLNAIAIWTLISVLYLYVLQLSKGMPKKYIILTTLWNIGFILGLVNSWRQMFAILFLLLFVNTNNKKSIIFLIIAIGFHYKFVMPLMIIYVILFYYYERFRYIVIFLGFIFGIFGFETIKLLSNYNDSLLIYYEVSGEPKIILQSILMICVLVIINLSRNKNEQFSSFKKKNIFLLSLFMVAIIYAGLIPFLVDRVLIGLIFIVPFVVGSYQIIEKNIFVRAGFLFVFLILNTVLITNSKSWTGIIESLTSIL